MKYSAHDIHRMREVLESTVPIARTSHPRDHALVVESQLVTYMSNETTPDELEAHCREQLVRDRQLRAALSRDR